MPNVGNVYVDFTAETAKFTAGVETINKKLDDFGEKAKKHGESGEGIFEKFLGAEVVAGAIEKVGDFALESAHKLSEFLHELAESDEKAVRLARALDIAVGSLQALQSAANVELGLDPDQLGKGMEHLSAAIGEAAKKAGPARDAFESIGLDAQKLADSKADEQLYSVLDALSQIDNASKRMQVAKDIMGEREFRELAPVIAEGSASLKQAAEHAREMGVALGDVDAEKIEKMAKSSKEFGEHIKGVGQQFLASFANAVGGGDKWQDKLFGSGEDNRELFDAFFLGAKQSISNAKSALEAFGVKFHETKELIKDDGTSHDVNVGRITIAEALTAANAELEKKLKDVERAHAVALASDSESAAGKEVDKLIAEYTRAGDVIPEEIAKIIDHVRELGDEEELKKLTTEWQRMIDTFDATEGEKKIEELREKFTDLDPALQPTLAHLQEMAHHLDELADHKKIADLTKELREQAEGATEAAKAVQKLRDAHASDAEIGSAMDLEDKIEANKELKKEVDEIKHLAEESLTPAQKLAQELGKIADAVSHGAIGDDVAAAARKKVNDEYDRSIAAENKLTGAMSRRFDFKLGFGPGSADANNKSGGSNGHGGPNAGQGDAAKGGPGKDGKKRGKKKKGSSFAMTIDKLPPLDPEEKQIQKDILTAVQKSANAQPQIADFGH